MLYGVPWGGLFYLLVLELVAVVAGFAAVTGSDDPLTTTIGWALLIGGAVLVLRCIRRIAALDKEP
jgi:energy-converting hydrogenase Eha subunit C